MASTLHRGPSAPCPRQAKLAHETALHSNQSGWKYTADAYAAKHARTNKPPK
jgi:hypothetical protein